MEARVQETIDAAAALNAANADKEHAHELIKKLEASPGIWFALKEAYGTAVQKIVNKSVPLFNLKEDEDMRNTLLKIKRSFDTFSRETYLVIPGLTDQYFLEPGKPLYDAAVARDEDAVLSIITSIPPPDLHLITTAKETFVHFCIKNLLVEPLRYLKSHEYRLLPKTKEEKRKSVIDILINVDYKNFGDVKKGREIYKILNLDIITFTPEQIRGLKDKRLLETNPARLAAIRGKHSTRRLERRAVDFPAVYYVLGHGSDYGRMMYTVPEDTLIFVKATPGQLIRVREKTSFGPLTDSHKSVYANPLKKNNLLYLIDKYKFFSVFNSGSKYPDFVYLLLSYFKIGDNYDFGYSGVVKAPFPDEPADSYRSLFSLSKDSLLADSVDKLVDLFKYSIYPKKESVKDFIDGYVETAPGMTIGDFISNVESDPFFYTRQLVLMAGFGPGAYYNFVCRINESTDKLYEAGFTIDESMREKLLDTAEESIKARDGLRQIVEETVQSRASVLHGALRSNSASASVTATASASAASASAMPEPKAAKLLFKIRIALIKLRQKFNQAKFNELLEYIKTHIKVFDLGYQIVGDAFDFLENNIHLVSEQIEQTPANIKNVIELYNLVVDKTEGNLKYIPSYLEQYVLKDADIAEFKASSDEDLIDKYRDYPNYIIDFIHSHTPKYHILTLAIIYEKYKFAKDIYFRNKKLATTPNKSWQNNYVYFYGPLFDLKEGFQAKHLPIYDIINDAKEAIDTPRLRNALTSVRVGNSLIYRLFIDYIRHFKLYEEFFTIRLGMRINGFQVPVAPPNPAADAASAVAMARGAVAAAAANSNSSSAASASSKSSKTGSNASGSNKTRKSPKKSH